MNVPKQVGYVSKMLGKVVSTLEQGAYQKNYPKTIYGCLPSFMLDRSDFTEETTLDGNYDKLLGQIAREE